MNKTFYQIEVSWDEKLLKQRAAPQSVDITTKDFFSKYYPLYCNWDWESYWSDRDGFYSRIPSPLEGKLWYKGPIDFMEACYVRAGMIACVSEKVVRIFHDLKVAEEEYRFVPINIKNERGAYYILFVPFQTVEELKIDFGKSYFNISHSLQEEKLTQFRGEKELDDYLELKGKPLLTHTLVLDPTLKTRDIINTRYIHGKIYFSDRIVNAFKKKEVIGYEVVQGRRDTPPLMFSDDAQQ